MGKSDFFYDPSQNKIQTDPHDDKPPEPIQLDQYIGLYRNPSLSKM